MDRSQEDADGGPIEGDRSGPKRGKMKPIYLDYAATTPTDRRVVAAISQP